MPRSTKLRGQARGEMSLDLDLDLDGRLDWIGPGRLDLDHLRAVGARRTCALTRKLMDGLGAAWCCKHGTGNARTFSQSIMRFCAACHAAHAAFQ